LTAPGAKNSPGRTKFGLFQATVVIECEGTVRSTHPARQRLHGSRPRALGSEIVLP
jgi:hypothetical protein